MRLFSQLLFPSLNLLGPGGGGGGGGEEGVCFLIVAFPGYFTYFDYVRRDLSVFSYMFV